MKLFQKSKIRYVPTDIKGKYRRQDIQLVKVINIKDHKTGQKKIY